MKDNLFYRKTATAAKAWYCVEAILMLSQKIVTPGENLCPEIILLWPQLQLFILDHNCLFPYGKPTNKTGGPMMHRLQPHDPIFSLTRGEPRLIYAATRWWLTVFRRSASSFFVSWIPVRNPYVHDINLDMRNLEWFMLIFFRQSKASRDGGNNQWLRSNLWNFPHSRQYVGTGSSWSWWCYYKRVPCSPKQRKRLDLPLRWPCLSALKMVTPCKSIIIPAPPPTLRGS